MGVKYRVEYKDAFDKQCKIDISKESYSGGIINLRGVGEKACVITVDCGDDPYEVLVNTKADISIWQEEYYPVDILELQQARDREFIIEFYINNELKFKGFMVPDGIQQTFQSAPFEININAIDGLKLLSGITYSHDNLSGGRCILNYLRRILFSNSNLGLPLPIRWVCALTNDAFPLEEDIFSGSVRWSPRGEGFTDYVGNTKDCLYILEEMLRSIQCRIVQDNGKWVIWRINDVITGVFDVRETPAVQTGFTINILSDVDHNKSIGRYADTVSSFDYGLVNEDAIITVLPGLKTVITKYEQDQRDNILPNGNMDIIDGIFNSPIYWYAPGATVQSVPSLSEATGSAVEVTNSIPNPATVFTLIDTYLPIDSDVLYAYINFGFKFSIENGATLDPDGFIVWDSTDFSLQVVYYNGLNTYFLNENGFWTLDITNIQITVASLKLNDIAQIDFNAKQNIILPLPYEIPIDRTTTPALQVLFNIPSGRKVKYDDIYLNVDTNSDVYEATAPDNTNTGKESYNLKISTSHNGFYVSNFMSNFDKSGLEKFFSDERLSAATLTEMNSHAILRNRYKSSLVFEGSIYGSNYSYSEIYTVQTLNDKKFLPLRSSWNTETNIVSLTMVEVRNDSLSASVKHYGSNDKTALSN